MKRLLLRFGALVFALPLLLVSATMAQAPLGYAFTDVNVVSMDGEEVAPGMTVIVTGDRIVTVAPTRTTVVPTGHDLIDASGKYLMPGLAEMHGHVPDARGNAASVEETLFLYVANGITTVRGMLGWPGQLALRERALETDLISPTLYLAGPSFSGNTINSVQQASDRVREQKAEGWDLLKIHPGLSVEQYDAMAETARAEQIRFGGHVPAAVGIRHALAAGQETFDHLDGYVEALDGMNGPIVQSELANLVALTKEHGAWVVPTMVLWETLFGVHSLTELDAFDELKYVSPAQREAWRRNYVNRINAPNFDLAAAQLVIDNRMMVLRALNASGARILMGTDAPQVYSVPGFSLHREVRRMADAGMSNFEVLKSGTVNVGEYFSNEDTFGMIKPGHRADLVLLNDNPLHDLAHLADREGVMFRGTWLPESEIDAMLKEIASRYGN